jgi:type IV secretion system protein TrbD
LWLIAVGVLARMAKVDPLLRHVYIRHIGYRDFYPAKSRMSAPPTTTPANWR